MNSNLKLLPATLLVAVLALAGCGGGSGGDTTPDPMPMPTPEEECLAGGGAVYEDGECKTAEDLREEGRDAEAAEREAAEAAEARQAAAKKIFGFLNATPDDSSTLLVVAPVSARPDSLDTTAGDLMDAYDAAKDADNMIGMEDKAQVAYMSTQGAGRQVDSVNTDDTRPVLNATLILAANARHIMGSGFATGTNEVVEHTNLKGEGDRTVQGSYMGAMGAYTCPTAADCTSQRTDNGVMLGGTGWTFTPNTGQKFTLPDASYAEFGWWLDENIAATAARVGAWYASGVDGAALPNKLSIVGATGSATYTGTAIGQAALYHRLGGDQNVGGAFTADAELMASFGATPMLGGTIDNFDVGGAQPDWVVKLNTTPLGTDSGALDPDDTTPENTTVWTIDGTDGDAGGSWSAQLYDIPTGSHQPVGVAGGFQASYESDGHMVGAFGAEQ